MCIAMIGAGYVGLVSAACFAEFGIAVACVDRDPERIARLKRGEMPIYEPGLADLVAANRQSGRLSFTTDLAAAMAGAEAIFIAVGTPSRRGDGYADLDHVFAAASEIAPALAGYAVIVSKSTVPVGTATALAARIAQERPALVEGRDFDVVSNPEFLREGSAISDFMRPDRIVIGSQPAAERARKVMGELYRPLFLLETPTLFCGRESAELIKYAANAFLATKISFINQISDLCERVGAEVGDVALGMGLDQRIGRKFLHVGPGFGGSCFPKDCLALIRTAREAGAPLSIVESVIASNDARKQAMVSRIIAACGGSVAGLTIAALGLTFKPNTDDLRESPSLVVLPQLAAAGAAVRAFDPEGMEAARLKMPQIAYAGSIAEALEGADALVILTEWNQFRALDLGMIRRRMRRSLVIDLRNIYRPESMRAAGIAYYSLGRTVLSLP